MRGAWIEMSNTAFHEFKASWSLPMRGAWIEIRNRYGVDRCHNKSLPMRGAWIEMSFWSRTRTVNTVAPHAGSVD